MGNKYTYAFIGLIALFCSNLTAQSKFGLISGKISDDITHETIVGALVTAGNNFASSNLDGNYKLRLPVGTYTVIFSYVGYKKTSSVLKVQENDSIAWDVT